MSNTVIHGLDITGYDNMKYGRHTKCVQMTGIHCSKVFLHFFSIFSLRFDLEYDSIKNMMFFV